MSSYGEAEGKEAVGGLMRLEDKTQIIYRCGKCGAEFTAAELELMPTIKCLYCGYRILYKVRPPGSKLIKAV
jgi:DNA-directed RNA polymerase subunit P